MKKHDETDFWAKVEKSPDCWYFQGFSERTGKAEAFLEGVKEPAARIAYRLTLGEPPEGRYLRRTCRNPACVNPDHLALAKGPNACLECGVPVSRYAKHCSAHRVRERVGV